MVVDFGFWIYVAIGIYMVVEICVTWYAFVVHGMWLFGISYFVFGVTGGLALPSDEARLAETPLEYPGVLQSTTREASIGTAMSSKMQTALETQTQAAIVAAVGST